MELGAWMARRLERGAPGGWLARLGSRTWSATMRLDRPLRWREGARVIVVGGATVGGSGKTPLAIACAEVLHGAGARVAVVGHAYRAHPGRARRVSPQDDVREVGDEALECAGRLWGRGVPVVVGRSRQAALDLALDMADVAVVDGPCQTTPGRASLALLAVDASSPWGSGLCPPQGDLRAPPPVLLAETDRVVAIGAGSLPGGVDFDRAEVVSDGAHLDGRLRGWEELRRFRVGLLTAIARPQRVVAMLEEHGVRPTVTIHGADHRAARRERLRPGMVDLWLCTPKCRTHLGPPPAVVPAFEGAVPVATLDYSLRLGESLKRALLDPYPARP